MTLTSPEYEESMTCFCTKPCRSEQGAVYVEALIMLPVLLVLWVGVLFMHNQYYQNQQARLLAKQCVWEYSQAGCKGPIPKACEQAPENLAEYEDNSGTMGFVHRKVENDGKMNENEHEEPVNNALKTDNGLFGRPTQVTLSKQYERPSLFGGGQRKTQAHQYLMCNEIDSDFVTKALEAVQGLGGGFP